MKLKKNLKWIGIVLFAIILFSAMLWNKQLNSITGLSLGGSSAFKDLNPKYVGEWDAGGQGYIIFSKNGDMKWYSDSHKDEKNVISGTWDVMKKDKYVKLKKETLLISMDSITVNGKTNNGSGQEHLMTIESFDGNTMILSNSEIGNFKGKKVK
jgi:hypothetical protein